MLRSLHLDLLGDGLSSVDIFDLGFRKVEEGRVEKETGVVLAGDRTTAFTSMALDLVNLVPELLHVRRSNIPDAGFLLGNDSDVKTVFTLLLRALGGVHLADGFEAGKGERQRVADSLRVVFGGELESLEFVVEISPVGVFGFAEKAHKDT